MSGGWKAEREGAAHHGLTLEFLHLFPFSKGIEALRKLRRVVCGRGSSLVRTTPPVVPLAKGDESV